MNLKASLEKRKEKPKTKRLIVGNSEAEVERETELLRAYGYKEETDILYSEVTHEFYQWWEYKTDDR